MIFPYRRAPETPPWVRNLALRLSRSVVEHHSFIDVRYPWESLSHHRVKAGTKPGAHVCNICGRWVVRGMGRWWER